MFVGGKARIWNNNGKWFNSSVEGCRRRRGSFNPETGKETQWEGYGEYVLLQLYTELKVPAFSSNKA